MLSDAFAKPQLSTLDLIPSSSDFGLPLFGIALEKQLALVLWGLVVLLLPELPIVASLMIALLTTGSRL